MVSRGAWTISLSTPSSPVAEGSPRSRVVPRRVMTMAEVMRLQMGVTEQSDSRLRKTLMRTLVGQVSYYYQIFTLSINHIIFDFYYLKYIFKKSHIIDCDVIAVVHKN
jgi:hypothetical protein